MLWLISSITIRCSRCTVWCSVDKGMGQPRLQGSMVPWAGTGCGLHRACVNRQVCWRWCVLTMFDSLSTAYCCNMRHAGSVLMILPCCLRPMVAACTAAAAHKHSDTASCLCSAGYQQSALLLKLPPIVAVLFHVFAHVLWPQSTWLVSLHAWEQLTRARCKQYSSS